MGNVFSIEKTDNPVKSFKGGTSTLNMYPHLVIDTAGGVFLSWEQLPNN